MPVPLRLLPLAFLCLALAACALTDAPAPVPSGARPGTAGEAAPPPPAPEIPRLVKVGPAGCASLSRNLARTLRSRQGADNMRAALAASLEHVLAQPRDREVARTADRSVTWRDLADALVRLESVLPGLARRPGLLCSRFSWYRLTPDPELTGYYTPQVRASAKPGPAHPYPIYAPPPEAANATGLPDRAAIDFGGALAGRNLELAWASDRLELFNMHVQGSGVLVYPDGSRRVAVFAGSNKRPFKGLGRMLLEGGHLSPENLAWEDVRAYFARNPDKMKTVFAGNESYVFFALRDKGPYGAMGKALTPMISLATDRGLVPAGAVLALSGARIVDGRGPERLDMLGLAQDAGSAITGARIDLYAGVGNKAAYTARRLKQPVRAYLLLPREK